MHRSSRSSTIAVAGLLVIGAVVAACGAIASPSTSPIAPVATPAGAPVGVSDPTPVPTPPVPEAPSVPLSTPGPDGVDGAAIPLDVFLDNPVTLSFSDPDHLIADARTGSAKDGMSVPWGQAVLRNLDPKTVEVTWVGLSGGEAITLVAKPQGSGVLLRFGQEAPPADSDAMGADRVVVLAFADPVDAADVATDFTTVDD
jgi:hypothetical protein